MDGDDEPIHARRIIIACGTRPARPSSVQFDDKTVIDSDGLLKLEHRVPRSMIVVGAGVIGVEYASMFGALGTKVTVVDKRDRVLNFLDSEIGEAFQYLLRRQNVTFRLREQVAGVDLDVDARGPKVRLESGKELIAETVLYAVGRQGDTEHLQLERPAWRPTRAAASRSTSATARPCRTSSRSATSSGGGLAATAMEQGRIATLHAFGEPVQTLPELVPTGVYAVPEIAMVGPDRGAADRRGDPLRRPASPAGASWPAG